jgi:acetyl-CoA acyltransferase
VARVSPLLAGLPQPVPGSTINRLCGSSLDAVAMAARMLKTGEASLVIAGGVKSMCRGPFVMGKADAPFSRTMRMEDTCSARADAMHCAPCASASARASR